MIAASHFAVHTYPTQVALSKGLNVYMAKPPSVILITGCSSGIGFALAEAFHALGHVVYATARQVDANNSLAQNGLRVLELDVTDPHSIATAVEAVRNGSGRLDMLINNAGYGQGGAVMDLTADVLRQQFETNVIAPVQLARAFLPLMLSQHQGRIVNIGSVSGVVTTPFAGAYCASKAALHALSEAMRMELTPFGIDVITVQPGKVISNVRERARERVSLPADSLYKPYIQHMENRARFSEQGAMPANAFARQIIAALLADVAPFVIRAGPLSVRMPLLQCWLPRRVFDKRLRTLFGLKADTSFTTDPTP
ncbi:SDR family NAD(P)-dependent oxidoreductase [Pseudomonas sp. PWP3-1b2]|uniref:SDR family NAD(P)-dependent oxidoreductase n=1 Tax=Pseudomonas sp. PWP3-1b2 TaxID=2804656 RepID=UPI003CEC97E3